MVHNMVQNSWVFTYSGLMPIPTWSPGSVLHQCLSCLWSSIRTNNQSQKHCRAIFRSGSMWHHAVCQISAMMCMKDGLDASLHLSEHPQWLLLASVESIFSFAPEWTLCERLLWWPPQLSGNKKTSRLPRWTRGIVWFILQAACAGV